VVLVVLGPEHGHESVASMMSVGSSRGQVDEECGPFRLGEERLGAFAAGEGDGAQEAKGESTVRLGKGRGGGAGHHAKLPRPGPRAKHRNGRGTVPGRTRPADATGGRRASRNVGP
jgi:hypothetical protein